MSSIFNNDVLKFNTDTIASQANVIEKIATSLETNQKTLANSLSTLRDDWDTGAGDAFFEQYNEEWTHNLDNHIKLLRDLAKALKYAASQYDPVEREFNSIRF